MLVWKRLCIICESMRIYTCLTSVGMWESSMVVNVTLKKKLAFLAKSPFFILILLAIAHVGLYFLNLCAGLIASGMLLLCFLVCGLVYRSCKKGLAKEAFRFSEYDRRMQEGFLENLEIPYVVMEKDGHIIWMNRMFRELFRKKDSYHKAIAGIFPTLSKERLKKIGHMTQLSLEWEDRKFLANIHREKVEDYQGELLDISISEESREVLVMFLADETNYQELLEKYEKERMGVALVYVDNYEEVVESIDSIKASMLSALVDRKISRYFSRKDILLKKFERDKYIIVFKQEYLREFTNNKFSLLEDIKTVHVGNEISVTLSIGVGAEGESYRDNHDLAKAAIDLALGRGGDQAVLKQEENITYFGASKRQVGKVSRVKARMKAQALRELIQTSDNVIVMGHHIGDADSFGATIGIYHAASMLGKKAHIVLNVVTSSIRPMKELFSPEKGYPADLFLSSDEALDLVRKDSMVMVVDTNRPSYTECPELLGLVDNIVVFDHHRHGKEVIDNAVLSYIEPYASSTCEMISEVLQYFSNDFEMSNEEADALYAGIIVDTNNFTTKTGVRTFEAAAYLRREGADVTRVRKMMQNDMTGYKIRAEAVRRAEVYRGCFAFTTCPSEGVESPTVIAAQAANELLNIIGIKASFVFTDYNDKIYISGRSIDEIDVQAVMECAGGGGHRSVAGAQISGKSIKEAMDYIKSVLDKRIEEGEIKL